MKVFFAKLSVLTSMLLLYGATSVWAQGKGKISFSGTVQASETEGGGNSKITPLAYAVVSLPEIGVATTTDVKGRFEIQLSNPGKYKVEISSLGYEPLSQTRTGLAQIHPKGHLVLSGKHRGVGRVEKDRCGNRFEDFQIGHGAHSGHIAGRHHVAPSGRQHTHGRRDRPQESQHILRPQRPELRQ